MMWLLSMDGRVTSDVIREFNAQSPRTVAIVGAAILEDCLERLLKLRFPVDGETKRELFKSTGAIGNLDVKIKMAYAFGILSKAAFSDFRTICEIRNKFAHRLDIDSFEHADVRHKCFDLKLIETHLFEAGQPHEDGLNMTLSVEKLAEKLMSPRDRFFLSVMFLHGINIHVPHPDNAKPRRPRALI
jgi:DNA-binding MltR family transcriptional regulator